MPTLSQIYPPSTWTVQSVVNYARSYPDLVPVLGQSGWTQEPALTFANDIMQKILAQGMDWKWNRAYVPPFLTVALQQDYITNVTDIRWLEYGRRIDINNSTNNGNLAPKPVFTMETVRDLGRVSRQGHPFQLMYIPNSLAYMGQWVANYNYACGYGVAMTPQTPIQQFVDANGNVLYIDSTALDLNINSAAFTPAPTVLPPTSPYGVSGTSPPVADPDTAPGTKIQDGTVVWTVADPNAYAIRVNPLPAFSGLVWLVEPVYQRVPPKINTLQDKLSPIPDAFAYLFRAGFIAMCKQHAGTKDANTAYTMWEEALMTAVRSADRELESAVFYPSSGLDGGGWGGAIGTAIGPANPYSGWEVRGIIVVWKIFSHTDMSTPSPTKLMVRCMWGRLYLQVEDGEITKIRHLEM